MIKDIKKFENLNQFISISVLAFDGNTCIYPVYVNSDKNRKHNVNTLLISNNNKFHYVLIKNMSRLLCTNHNIGQKFFCNYCLHGFYKELALLNLVDDCRKFGIQKVLLSDNEHKCVKFKSIQKMILFLLSCMLISSLFCVKLKVLKTWVHRYMPTSVIFLLDLLTLSFHQFSIVHMNQLFIVVQTS